MDPERDRPFGDTLEFYRRWRATKEQIRVEDVLRKYGSLAVVQVHGAIDRNLTQMELDCTDACDLKDINAAIADCSADDSLHTVVFDFDTPGGTCVGHVETADLIVLLRQKKQVVAWIGGECCSLGYYLASQCDFVVIGASGWAGSVGVRCARLDMTAALAKQGVAVTLVASSDEKTDGSPAKPMTQEERQRMQARVDSLYQDFKDRVRSARPGVSDDVMRAQIYRGQEAVSAGLADAVGTSLDELAVELLVLAAEHAPQAPVPTAPALPGPSAQDDRRFPSAEGGGNPNHDPDNGEFTSGSGGSSSSSARTPAPKTPSTKSERAKAAHFMVDKGIQRYAEERNEPRFAQAIGGTHRPGNGPTDVEYTDANGKVHGIELKTVVGNTNQKLTMKVSAQKLKRSWERKNKGVMHTVVMDDTNVRNANGPDQHDEAKRVYYYRRGVGSFRLGSMHTVATVEDVKKLIEMPAKNLPPLAKKR